jgi:predicted transcriptional regulator
MKTIHLADDQALIMQIVGEFGEEDVEDLAVALSFERTSLLNVLRNLQHKGMIIIKNRGYGMYVQLSSKGKKTVDLLWPELPYLRYG